MQKQNMSVGPCCCCCCFVVVVVVVVDLRITAQKKKLTLKHFFFGFLNLN